MTQIGESTPTMLRTHEGVETHSRSMLIQWAAKTLELPGLKLQVQIRGNNLHLLCEGPVCPPRAIVESNFARGLQTTALQSLLPPDRPQIYEVFLYGRAFGQKRPLWTVRLDPQNPEVRDRVDDASTAPTPPSEEAGAPPAPDRLQRWARQLSRRGDRDGHGALVQVVERYLSETLSVFGVSVKVTISEVKTRKSEAPEATPAPQRLWIFCQSAYIPEPSLLAEPVAERVRDLELDGFQDAVILGQVRGENKPEWILRVDLTPATTMLQTWAKWGDVQAIARLLDRALLKTGGRVSGVLKESTLHLFCGYANPDRVENFDSANLKIHKETTIAAITPVLEAIAPQGIHAATLYGCRDPLQSAQHSQAPPLWVDWIEIGAARDPDLSFSSMELARQGNLDALQFLLDRLLNPDLDTKLATGGIRVSLRQKGDILHVMLDAPICPQQSELAPKIAKFLRQLDIEAFAGVRLYGRRAGQKHPQWRHATDFSAGSARTETAPEFAVSETDSNDLLPEPGGLILHPDFTQDDLQACLTKTPTPASDQPRSKRKGLARALLKTGLFVTQKAIPTGNTNRTPIALVWGALGLLLVVQADRFLGGQSWPPPESSDGAIALTQTEGEPTEGRSLEVSSPEAPATDANAENAVFDESGFTRAQTAADEGFSYEFPSFNSDQLDRQIASYLEFVAREGTPDVLIVGSSRALRGVDPVNLEKELADRYPNLNVFNFGVNGATAQVVDFIVRELIPVEQLPKLILWADGARAFNSGRDDRTFEAIVASEGYREIQRGVRPAMPESADDRGDRSLASLSEALAATAKGQLSLRHSYENLNDWLNDALAGRSAIYPRRDRLHAAATEMLSQLAAPSNDDGATPTVAETPEIAAGNDIDPERRQALARSSSDLLLGTQPNGFLPLSIRFDPNTYYEKHARVSGDYDADYESFQLNGIQTAALKNLLELTQAQQIPVVFINLPLTEEYLDPVRQEYEDQFQTYMLRLSIENQGFNFRDLSDLWPSQNEHFSDPSHLNRYGAYEVSVHLSQDPMIPWPRTQ